MVAPWPTAAAVRPALAYPRDHLQDESVDDAPEGKQGAVEAEAEAEAGEKELAEARVRAQRGYGAQRGGDGDGEELSEGMLVANAGGKALGELRRLDLGLEGLQSMHGLSRCPNLQVLLMDVNQVPNSLLSSLSTAGFMFRTRRIRSPAQRATSGCR